MLSLEAEEQDAARLIRSEMYVAWANLLDLTAKKLRRYGDVDPEVSRKLDSHVIRLSKLAIDLANLFEDTGEDHEHD